MKDGYPKLVSIHKQPLLPGLPCTKCHPLAPLAAPLSPPKGEEILGSLDLPGHMLRREASTCQCGPLLLTHWHTLTHWRVCPLSGGESLQRGWMSPFGARSCHGRAGPPLCLALATILLPCGVLDSRVLFCVTHHSSCSQNLDAQN